MPGGVRASRGVHDRADHRRVGAGRPPLGARHAGSQPLRHEVGELVRAVRGGRGEELVEDRRGVRRRAGHRHGGLHKLRRRRGVHPLPQPRLPAGRSLRGKRAHTRGDGELRLGQDGRGAQGCGMGDELELRREPEIRHGDLRPLPLRRHEPGGFQVRGALGGCDRIRRLQPARGPLRVGRTTPASAWTAAASPSTATARPASRSRETPRLSTPRARRSRSRRRSLATSSTARGTSAST